MSKKIPDEIVELETKVANAIKDGDAFIEDVVDDLMKICTFYVNNKLFAEGLDSFKLLSSICLLEFGPDDPASIESARVLAEALKITGIKKIPMDKYFKDVSLPNSDFSALGEGPNCFDRNADYLVSINRVNSIEECIEIYKSIFNYSVDFFTYDSHEACSSLSCLVFLLTSSGYSEVAIDLLEDAICTVTEDNSKSVFLVEYTRLIADVFEYIDDYDNALHYRKKATAISLENGLGENSYFKVTFELNQTRINGKKELDEALMNTIFTQNRLISTVGIDSPEYYSVTVTLSDIYMLMGDFEKASECILFVLDHIKAIHKKEDELILLLYMKLINLYQNIDEYEKALSYAYDAYGYFDNGNTDNSMNLLMIKGTIGDLLSLNGELEESLALLEEVEESWECCGLGNSQMALEVKYSIVEVLAALDEYTKAIGKMQKIYKEEKRQYGEESIRTLAAIKDLAELYMMRNRKGDIERAIKYIEPAFETLLGCYGLDCELTQTVKDIMDELSELVE